MTFRACESVSYYATTQRQLKHIDFTKSTGLKKKIIKEHVKQLNFSPSS